VRAAAAPCAAGSYLAVGIVGVGMYGASFFLTYYLQQMLGFSPIAGGAAHELHLHGHDVIKDVSAGGSVTSVRRPPSKASSRSSSKSSENRSPS
jgi:hypothetical protein